ncbi:hypothetical protein ENUP19_0050G0075 [Entamoeba nuttalli]|uniref:Cyclin-dependent kinase 2 n=2 Tax=Entamoeba nuttalli TaxID=412467 RepID=K2HT53_ENTNP|nr:cell division protein kinase 2, putative [Entamoeba nuttalli P19]EKE39300.1 cell division protein kinase 2, putative [Entamoeba nuttalli P19]|eukprot:XP_008858362.1 cell division protein kinase 2, putative [Entamoeba nuttalli P19]
MTRYEKKQQLGEGTYGVVCKAWDTVCNRYVALKKIKQEREDDGIPVTSVREIAVLLELKHPNVVDLYDIYLEDKFLYLVFEFCDEDLYQFMSRSSKIPINETRSIVYQILQGLAFCHYHQILHRDMKPQNILINKNGTIKLGDFGLARLTTINDRKYTSEVVTLWYRAPEILLGATQYGGAIDIWSTAAIFGELINKEELFKGRCKIDQLFKIFSQLGTPTEDIWNGVTKLPFYLSTFPKWKAKDLHTIFHTDERAVDLLQKMFIYTPGKRISAADALKHPFFDPLNKPNN